MWSQERDGKVRYFERYTDPLTGKQKTISVTLNKSGRRAEKEAREILTDRIRELTSNPYMVKPENRTLGQLRDMYLSALRSEVSSSTLGKYRTSLKSVLDIIGEDSLYSRLTVLYIRQALLDTGKEPGTLNNYIRFLKAMLAWSYKNDMIPDSKIVDKLERFKDIPHKEKIEDKYLEAEELQTLLDALIIPEWRALAKLLALSGMRIGEAISLNRSDVDFEHRCIHVTKSFNSNAYEVVTAKNSSSIRDVHMQPELEECCREIVEMVRARKIQSTLFFPNDKGKVIVYTSFERYLKRTSLKVIGRGISSHALRHTHASLLFEAGYTYDEVARRLGHRKGSQVTKDIYVHITEKLRERDAAKLDQTRLLR